MRQGLAPLSGREVDPTIHTTSNGSGSPEQAADRQVFVELRPMHAKALADEQQTSV